MNDQSLLRRDSIKKSLLEFCYRCAWIGMLALVALLCAPMVNSPKQDRESAPTTTPAAIAEPTDSRVGVKLRSGDTLGSVLKRFGVAPPSAHAMIEKLRPFLNPRRVRPGDDVAVVLNGGDRTVQAMEFVVDDALVRVKATGQGWFAERHEIPFVREKQIVRGTIKGSLYESGTEAGLTPQHIVDLAKIFESDIDFFSDFQPGDGFSVIVETLRYADGRRGEGRILAAELEAENELHNAYYFLDGNATGGYYNRDGQALRRSFLRAPLSYARISSPFSATRLHPIFRTVRPHLAIDYAAPAGTPVVSIGSGKVEFIGQRNGYGNVVDVRHSASYMSRYAHFSRFAVNLRKGHWVDVGDVIGFVGQTGHATGPHLHFEFLQGGTKVNFLNLRIPKEQQLSGQSLVRFERLREQQEALLRKGDDKVVNGASNGL
jgi:murein DD-endopeptidase MepM/ murein hydrolase activator NlpD